MKRFILTMMAVVTLASAANAMSYKSARDQAFFLTDKMAYELALSDDQYNAVFEINMDYLMCLDMNGDIFGTYWTRRNNELRFVLSPVQYQYYMQREYFYRPVIFEHNKFVFTIYNHYPKNRFFNAAPPGYQVYKGSNRYFDHSAYGGRTFGAPNDKPHTNPGMGGPKPGNGGKNQPGMNKKQAVNEGKQRMTQSRRH